MTLCIDSSVSALYIDGVRHHKSLEFDKAFKLFQEAAKHAHVRATVFLGICYFEGKGVRRNRVKAFKYWKSVEESHPYALYYMGRCYEAGSGVEQHSLMAIDCYRRSASKGCVVAYRELGYCYLQGRGVGRNKNSAILHFQKAADKGDLPSLHWLGWRAQVKGQAILATKYFALAAAKGHEESCLAYAQALQNGKGCTVNHELAERYIDFAAQRGNKKAIECKNEIWENKKSACLLELRKYWLHCLEQNQNDLSFIPLGLAYFYGYGLLKYPDQAEKYLRCALNPQLRDKIDPELLTFLGKAWLEGRCFRLNTEAGISCLKAAIHRGSLRAIFTLCDFYEERKEIPSLLELLKAARRRNHPDLWVRLGVYVEDSLKRAEYFQRAKQLALGPQEPFRSFYCFPTEEAALLEIERAQKHLGYRLLPDINQSAKILYNLGRENI